jgi:hypothetical protein
MALESASYYVMKHYSLSLRDLDALSTDEFSMMFTWAAAADSHAAEKQKESMGDSKSKMRVAGTDVGRPMPHSR